MLKFTKNIAIVGLEEVSSLLQEGKILFSIETESQNIHNIHHPNYGKITVICNVVSEEQIILKT